MLQVCHGVLTGSLRPRGFLPPCRAHSDQFGAMESTHEKAQVCREFITVPAFSESLPTSELPADAFVPGQKLAVRFPVGSGVMVGG